MFFPSSEIEVAAILSEAKEPLSVAGGNTRVLAPSGSKIISTSKLSGVIDYEPGALTMIAKAGTPLSEIQKTPLGNIPKFPGPARETVLRNSLPSSI